MDAVVPALHLVPIQRDLAMTLAYIRKTYDVPAKRGARIEWTDERGQKWVGRVVGPSSDGARLKVQFDVHGKRRRSILHPTDGVRYL